MALRLGDTVPDFEADTTEGRISFHAFLGDSWGVLFSHPADFTPVCTTELGTVAKLKPEFERRNTKVIGLSVDPLDAHTKWIDDINETHKELAARGVPFSQEPADMAWGPFATFQDLDGNEFGLRQRTPGS